MTSKERLIFSERYPKHDPDKRHQEAEKLPAESTGEWSASRLRQEFEENSVYVLRPDKVMRSRQFINLAKRLSQAYRIDADITKYEHLITVKLFMSHSIYTGPLKDELSWLLTLCDRFLTFPDNKDPNDFILFLDYCTHDLYISGRKIE